ncbi:hypothetical protein G9A89_006981 [Geosiphon pyriformis]|nr:hypothetical protein G9A89_006981 [Geosiphon pyriformis]
MYSVDFPTAVTYARDFKAAKLETNYAQAVNLLTIAQFINLHNNTVIKETLIIFKISCVFQCSPISYGSKRCMFTTTVVNKNTLEPTAESIITHNREINIETPIADVMGKLGGYGKW